MFFPSLQAQRGSPAIDRWIASSRSFFVMTAGCFLLSSCLTPTGTQEPAKVLNYGQGGAGTTGMHTVFEGETLYAVSQRYNLPLREIITLNSLSAPYNLQAGYRLKLPPPNDYKVRAGDTLNAISRTFNVSVSEMARINSIPPPYVIETGQTVRLPTPQPRLAEQLSAPSSGSAVTSSSVGAVEREELAPPTGETQTASAGTNQAGGKPGALPDAKSGASAQPAVQTAASPPAKVQQASAALPSNVSPKIPARTGKFMRPVDGQVISSYGPKDGGLHNDGINIRAPRGTAVRAAEHGVIAYSGNEMAGYGNLILIRHSDGWMTAYAHMDKALVNKGDVVKAGQSIGTIGSTGAVDSPQLHFEIRKGTRAVNPAQHL